MRNSDLAERLHCTLAVLARTAPRWAWRDTWAETREVIRHLRATDAERDRLLADNARLRRAIQEHRTAISDHGGTIGGVEDRRLWSALDGGDTDA